MYTVDLYRRVRRAHFVEGMSIREVARVFDLHRSTVNKMLEYSAPPGYQRQQPPRRPKLDLYTPVIDQILQPHLDAECDGCGGVYPALVWHQAKLLRLTCLGLKGIRAIELLREPPRFSKFHPSSTLQHKPTIEVTLAVVTV